MTTIKMPGLRVRRVLFVPRCPTDQRSIQHDGEQKNPPAMLRRSYAFSFSCGKDGEDGAQSPLYFHVHGERSEPLLRCLAVGAAAAGVIGMIGLCARVRRNLRLRKKYADRYAARLKAERLKRSRTQA